MLEGRRGGLAESRPPPISRILVVSVSGRGVHGLALEAVVAPRSPSPQSAASAAGSTVPDGARPGPFRPYPRLAAPVTRDRSRCVLFPRVLVDKILGVPDDDVGHL